MFRQLIWLLTPDKKDTAPHLQDFHPGFPDSAKDETAIRLVQEFIIVWNHVSRLPNKYPEISTLQAKLGGKLLSVIHVLTRLRSFSHNTLRRRQLILLKDNEDPWGKSMLSFWSCVVLFGS